MESETKLEKGKKSPGDLNSGLLDTATGAVEDISKIFGDTVITSIGGGIFDLIGGILGA